jgi:hypothetical protein
MDTRDTRETTDTRQVQGETQAPTANADGDPGAPSTSAPTTRYEQIQYERGKAHAAAQRPPSSREPAYLHGYEDGGGSHIIPT